MNNTLESDTGALLTFYVRFCAVLEQLVTRPDDRIDVELGHIPEIIGE